MCIYYVYVLQLGQGQLCYRMSDAAALINIKKKPHCKISNLMNASI